MDVQIQPLAERDLPEADRIFRLAFGTFLGLPDPMSFLGDGDLICTRWRADPASVLGAYDGDRLVGSNLAANWGSFGFFGPLTIRPDLWDKGIAKKLLGATMDLFDRWGVRQTGLFTFPDSPKHIALYRRFGFERQSLTPVMSKPVAGADTATGWTTYSGTAPDRRVACLAEMAALTSAIFPGLDVTCEVEAADAQGLGETVLLREDGVVAAFAVCHVGAGTEAGGDSAYVKFGAALPGAGAATRFDRLLAACEAMASARGLKRVVAGTNAAREEAYTIMQARGFRPFLQGVAMQRPGTPGFNRPDCFVIDDWR